MLNHDPTRTKNGLFVSFIKWCKIQRTTKTRNSPFFSLADGTAFGELETTLKKTKTTLKKTNSTLKKKI
jgi:uncharacterized protein YheU (UPF0270 family)